MVSMLSILLSRSALTHSDCHIAKSAGAASLILGRILQTSNVVQTSNAVQSVEVEPLQDHVPQECCALGVRTAGTAWHGGHAVEGDVIGVHGQLQRAARLRLLQLKHCPLPHLRHLPPNPAPMPIDPIDANCKNS